MAKPSDGNNAPRYSQDSAADEQEQLQEGDQQWTPEEQLQQYAQQSQPEQQQWAQPQGQQQHTPT
jgi:hypothetical protein